MGWITQIIRTRRQLRRLKKYDLILVHWDDIESDSSWVSADEMLERKAVKCVCTGFFIGWDDKQMRVSSELIFEDGRGSIEVLPIGCVTSIECLKKAVDHKLEEVEE